jgi:hypothetical protein
MNLELPLIEAQQHIHELIAQRAPLSKTLDAHQLMQHAGLVRRGCRLPGMAAGTRADDPGHGRNRRRTLISLCDQSF